MVQTLNHRRSFSQGEISQIIQNILYRGQQTSKIDTKYIYSREEKNIRRRIYDALNVMYSAGFLKREGKTKPSLTVSKLDTDY